MQWSIEADGDGALTLYNGLVAVIEGWRFGLRIDGEDRQAVLVDPPSRRVPIEPGRITSLPARVNGADITLLARPATGGSVIVRIRGESDVSGTLDELVLMMEGTILPHIPARETRVLRNGWTPGDVSGSTSSFDLKDGDVSHWFTVFGSPERAAGNGPTHTRKAYLGLGFATFHDNPGLIRYRGDRPHSPRITCISGMSIIPDSKLVSEILWVGNRQDASTLLETYAEEVAGRTTIPKPRPIATVWSTWQGFGEGVTASDVEGNLSLLREHFPHLDHVRVDDGYQMSHIPGQNGGLGDWLVANEKFPGGLSRLAGRIRSAGFNPGLWLAPFCIGEHSGFFTEHPEAVVKGDSGDPMVMGQWRGETVYGLDPTHPAAISFLQETIRGLVEMGFEHLLLDHLHVGAVPGTLSRPDVTPVQALILGLTAIRETAGERTFLLGSRAPLGPSLGLLDGITTSGSGGQMIDGITTSGTFGHGPEVDETTNLSEGMVSLPIRSLLIRSSMQGRWWQHAPGSLVVSGNDGAPSMGEVRTNASITGLSGAMVTLSDDLRSLSPERRAILSRLFPVFNDETGHGALAHDIMVHGTPRILTRHVERTYGDWFNTVYVNTGQEEVDHPRLDLRTVTGSDGSWVLFDFWEQRCLGVGSGFFELPPLGPGCCHLLSIRRNERFPQFLGDDIHVTQGGVELVDVINSPDSVTATVEHPYLDHGTLSFSIPEGLAFRELEVHEGSASGSVVAGVVSVTARWDKRARFTVRYGKV